MKIEVSILAQNKVINKAKKQILTIKYRNNPIVCSIFLGGVALSYMLLTQVFELEKMASGLLSLYIPTVLLLLLSNGVVFLSKRRLPLYHIIISDDDILFSVFDSKEVPSGASFKNVSIIFSQVIAITKHDYGFIVQIDMAALTERDRQVLSSINVMMRNEKELFIVLPRESFVTYRGLKFFSNWLENTVMQAA